MAIEQWRAQERARRARIPAEERNRRACERRNAAALAAAKKRRPKKAPKLEPEETLVLRVRTEDGRLLATAQELRGDAERWRLAQAPTLTGKTCRGSIVLGSACGHCSRCAAERARLKSTGGDHADD